MTPQKAYSLLLIAIASISLSPILTRYASAPSLSISAFRLLFATLLTYVIGSKAIRSGLRNIDKKNIPWMILSGIALALHFWSWIESLRFTSIASSTLLVCTHPLIVLPASIFLFQEKLTLKKGLGLILTLMGTYLLSGLTGVSSLSSGLYGNVLALIGALFVGIYLIIGKKIRPTVDNDTYTFVVYAVATLLLWLLQTSSKIDITTFQARDYLIFILLAIFPTLLGHTLFNKVLSTLSATTVSLATLGEPILASIYALVLFQESISAVQWMAGCLILIGITLSELPGRHKKKTSDGL